MTQRTEVRDGGEYTVTVLPSDRRLAPGATRKRQLFQALSGPEKSRFIKKRIRKARKKRRRDTQR